MDPRTLCCVFLFLSVLVERASKARALMCWAGKMIGVGGGQGGDRATRRLGPQPPRRGPACSGAPLNSTSGWRGKNGPGGLGVLLRLLHQVAVWPWASHCPELGPKGGSTWEVGIGKDVLMNFQTHRGCLPWKVVSAVSLEKSVQDVDARQEVDGMCCILLGREGQHARCCII